MDVCLNSVESSLTSKGFSDLWLFLLKQLKIQECFFLDNISKGLDEIPAIIALSNISSV